jgi:hypothetical protein
MVTIIFFFEKKNRYGNMVAFFKYSPVDILSVDLPPSVLDFNFRSPQEWLKSVAIEVCYFIVLAETTLIFCILRISPGLKNNIVLMYLSIDIWQNGIVACGGIRISLPN